MDPKFQDSDFSDLTETTRRMKVLAESPGELRFRQEVASGFEKVNTRLGAIDVRLARIEERQLSRVDVAGIAKTEIEAKFGRLENRVQTLQAFVWLNLGAFITAMMVVIVSKITGTHV